MAVLRIVADIKTDEPAGCAAFYTALFGLDVAMDMGWITTLHAPQSQAPVQISFAREGGSGAEVPALSIEVDDLDAVLERLAGLGRAPEYGPALEPWGVRRFFARDPAGTLLNILTHDTSGT